MIDLKKIRKELGLTQDKLAKSLSSTQNNICQFETFKKQIPLEIYNKCIELFGEDIVKRNLIQVENYFNELPKNPKNANKIQELRKEIKKFNLEMPLLKEADFAILNTDDCMHPRVLSNDYILLKSMNNETPIFGNIYFIKTNDLNSLRYVKKGNTDDNYLLVAENKHYEDLIINKADIINMFLMVGRMG